MSDGKGLSAIKGEIIFETENGVTFDETGLTVSGPLSYEQWESAVELFAGHENRSKLFHAWGWGDLLAQGEARFGEKYSQAMSKTGQAYQTLANYKWVAEYTPKHLRGIPGLSLSHYMRVARVKDDGLKAALLLQAGEEGWTVDELSAEMDRVSKRLIADGEEIDEAQQGNRPPPPATKDDQIYDLTVDNHRLDNERQAVILKSDLVAEKVNEAIALIAPILDRVSPDIKDTLTQVVEVLCSIPNNGTIRLINTAIDQYRGKQMADLVKTLDQLIERLEN